MREYATPAAFRAAAETSLRERARRLSAPAYMVRRQAALERLLLRLMKVAPDRWALKGGLALETRLGERARVSIDLDADHVHGADAARADLQRAAIAFRREARGVSTVAGLQEAHQLLAQWLDPVLAEIQDIDRRGPA